ncbi:MAG: hypothetical protein U0528_12045 [Anaerolineae bacterium]
MYRSDSAMHLAENLDAGTPDVEYRLLADGLPCVVIDTVMITTIRSE